MEKYAIIEKADPLAVHGLFYTAERARQFLRDVTPKYVARGYFINKTLTADSFCVAERVNGKWEAI